MRGSASAALETGFLGFRGQARSLSANLAVSFQARGYAMSRNILRKKAVQARTGLSDTTIWRLEKAGQFPCRIRLTEGGAAVGWYEDEIEQFEAARERAPGRRPGVVSAQAIA